jgi:MoaA/NifB/PqqE/SkfB family radical SAM enzyme
VFALRQFDAHPADLSNPPYPKRIIFRLANTCNLACIMCDGDTSSRIRAEFEKRPPLKPFYGERFFDELREMLPHLEHVEFYGGEPFLVKEHLRVLELIAETGARCSIYVNTNATVLTDRIKRYLETLNFTTIAISMDSVNPDLHFRIRTGLKGEIFARNLDWYLDFAARRRIRLLLNVTEHRKNWFEIPEIFRFAEQHKLYIHVNTCIHPANVTLYTLPFVQLAYVLDFVEHQRERLIAEYGSFRNLPSYDYFVSLVRNELKGRSADWTPPPQPPTALCDGLLGAPIPGKGVCARPDEFLLEVKRAVRLDRDTAARFTGWWRNDVAALTDLPGWSRVARVLDGESSADPDRPATVPALHKRLWKSLSRT